MSWSFFQVSGEVEVIFECGAGNAQAVSHTARVNARDEKEAIGLWLDDVPYDQGMVIEQWIISVRVSQISEAAILRQRGERELPGLGEGPSSLPMTCHACGIQSFYELFVAQRFAGGRVRLACPKCGARYQPPDPGEMYDRQIKNRESKDKGENENVR